MERERTENTRETMSEARKAGVRVTEAAGGNEMGEALFEDIMSVMLPDTGRIHGIQITKTVNPKE